MGRRDRSAEQEEAPEIDLEGTWWDRRDEPPRAMTETVVRASDALGRLLRPKDDEPSADESDRARLVRTAVLALTFLVVVWLILTAIIEQT